MEIGSVAYAVFGYQGAVSEVKILSEPFLAASSFGDKVRRVETLRRYDFQNGWKTPSEPERLVAVRSINLYPTQETALIALRPKWLLEIEASSQACASVKRDIEWEKQNLKRARQRLRYLKRLKLEQHFFDEKAQTFEASGNLGSDLSTGIS